jgi:hypothetical protein
MGIAVRIVGDDLGDPRTYPIELDIALSLAATSVGVWASTESGERLRGIVAT